MPSTPDRDAVLNALRIVNDPDLHRDIVSLGFIKDLSLKDGHVSLAMALAQCGGRVGILDGDIYGPNVPIMLGLSSTQLTTDGKQIVPAEKHGVQVVSMGFLTSDDSPVIWRGPMLHGAIQQFFREV